MADTEKGEKPAGSTESLNDPQLERSAEIQPERTEPDAEGPGLEPEPVGQDAEEQDTLAEGLGVLGLQGQSKGSGSEVSGSKVDEAVGFDLNKSAAEAWVDVEAYLHHAREEGKRLRALEEEAFEYLDAYFFSYGSEGQEVAGDWPRLVENRRRSLKAGTRELERLAEVRRAEQAEKKAREAVLQFQQESAARAAELQRQLTEATRRRAQVGGSYQRVDGYQPRDQPRPKRCLTCGLAGVERGRDCPNVANHYMHPRRD